MTLLEPAIRLPESGIYADCIHTFFKGIHYERRETNEELIIVLAGRFMFEADPGLLIFPDFNEFVLEIRGDVNLNLDKRINTPLK